MTTFINLEKDGGFSPYSNNILEATGLGTFSLYTVLETH
jgi:hypothetical protein